MDFGSSGSGVVRQWRPYSTARQLDGTVYQYSFVGPLSLSKGCDYAITLRRTRLDDTQDVSPLFDYAYRGSKKKSVNLSNSSLQERTPP